MPCAPRSSGPSFVQRLGHSGGDVAVSRASKPYQAGVQKGDGDPALEERGDLNCGLFPGMRWRSQQQQHCSLLKAPPAARSVSFAGRPNGSDSRLIAGLQSMVDKTIDLAVSRASLERF